MQNQDNKGKSVNGDFLWLILTGMKEAGRVSLSVGLEHPAEVISKFDEHAAR